MDSIRLSGYVPGTIGKVIELHALYYSKNWGFGLYFESKVAKELSAFLDDLDKRRDGFWVALADEQIVGAVAIVGGNKDPTEARLRWFIVAQDYQGRGIGNLLMKEALTFCRHVGFKRVYLTTFGGLDPARRLYEKWGFTLCEEEEDRTWGVTVKEQLFRLML